MAELQLTAYAKQDLADIWDYLAELNPDAAHRLIDELISKFHFLSNNPLSGKARYELLLNLRSLPHKRYTIFYLPLENGVEIYRVLHGARDIPQVFDDMLPKIG